MIGLLYLVLFVPKGRVTADTKAEIDRFEQLLNKTFEVDRGNSLHLEERLTSEDATARPQSFSELHETKEKWTNLEQFDGNANSDHNEERSGIHRKSTRKTTQR